MYADFAVAIPPAVTIAPRLVAVASVALLNVATPLVVTVEEKLAAPVAEIEPPTFNAPPMPIPPVITAAPVLLELETDAFRQVNTPLIVVFPAIIAFIPTRIDLVTAIPPAVTKLPRVKLVASVAFVEVITPAMVLLPVKLEVPVTAKFVPIFTEPPMPTPPEKMAEPELASVDTVVFVLVSTPLIVSAGVDTVEMNVEAPATLSVVQYIPHAPLRDLHLQN